SLADVRNGCRQQKERHAAGQVQSERGDVARPMTGEHLTGERARTYDEQSRGFHQLSIPADELADCFRGQLAHSRIRWDGALPARSAEVSVERCAAIQAIGRPRAHSHSIVAGGLEL